MTEKTEPAWESLIREQSDEQAEAARLRSVALQLHTQMLLEKASYARAQAEALQTETKLLRERWRAFRE
jgi:hypothetical protein